MTLPSPPVQLHGETLPVSKPPLLRNSPALAVGARVKLSATAPAAAVLQAVAAATTLLVVRGVRMWGCSCLDLWGLSNSPLGKARCGETRLDWTTEAVPAHECQWSEPQQPSPVRGSGNCDADPRSVTVAEPVRHGVLTVRPSCDPPSGPVA
ncbi:hypothetical protein GCM10009664_71120 [Kitasatospora gansuensis]